MANISHISLGNGVFSWALIANGDTLEPLIMNKASGILGTVQMTGTFGGTVGLEASLDNINYFDISDVQGTVIAATAAGLFEFATGAVYLRPKPGVGVTATNVMVRLTR